MAIGRRDNPSAGAPRLFPTEQVLLLAVSLPAMSAAQRRLALPFAVEERIAQPLETVRVVVGPQQADGSWLVAVVSRADLDASTDHDPASRLIPDVMLVAAPSEGWAMVESNGRVLVRDADGTGFACQAADAAMFWRAADNPPVVFHGDRTPPGIEIKAHAPLPPPDPNLAWFDLRAGQSSAEARLPRSLVRVVSVLALALAGHLAVMIADNAALGRLVASREAELRATLPGGESGDLDAALAAALGTRQPQTQGSFLPILARMAEALEPQGGGLAFRDIRYAAEPPAITATVEASDLAMLQDAEAALIAAGLAATAGAASSADGVAEVSMRVGSGGI